MPELPEVENTVCRLRPLVEGRTIKRAVVRWPRSVVFPSPRLFRRRIKNLRIAAIERRAKFLVFRLESGRVRKCPPVWLVAHLRMSGSFHMQQSGQPDGRWVRAFFELSGGGRLCFKDARKFGRFWLVDDPERVLGGLGPEPLARSFVAEEFLRRLKGRKTRIKPLLLNQRFIAGIGNIYADESLWRAGIHPRRRADRLSEREGRKLHRAIRAILRRAIQDQGTDIGDEVVCGDYEPRIYGRQGEPCRRCRTPVLRLVVGQRGTYICPRCQQG